MVAVLTLAIGIGGTTTIFSAIDALLLRPLPYRDQDRLVALSNSYPRFPRDRGPVSSTDVAHWRADNQVFEQIEFVSRPDMVAMSSAGSAERVGVQHVSARLLPLLGIRSFLGSIPTDEKTVRLGSTGVALSYEFWQRHFAGDPKILGRSVFVDTFSGPVIAVLNPGFNLFGSGPPEIFIFEGMGNAAESGINDTRWLTPDHVLYMGDAIAGRILKVDPQGSVLGSFTGPQPGQGPHFDPHQIALAPDGSIFTAEVLGWRAEKLRPK